MKKFGIKEVVATGIGTALFIVLTEVQIPLGIIPNTSMQPRAAVLAFLAAVVALRTKRKIFSYKIQKPLLKRNLKKDA